MPQASAANEAWYLNPWVWLLIAIPSLTIVGCMLTIYLALTNPHILVDDAATDDYTAAGTRDSGSE